MLEPVKRSRLYEEIVKQLTDLINSGDLKPGDRLPTERALAAELRVSRTAIREALRALELMGFIESRVGEGTFVREITMRNVIEPFSTLLSQDVQLVGDLIEVRMILEPEVARLAARRVTPEKAEVIEAALETMAAEIASDQLGIVGDNAFHDALAAATENNALSRILNLCSDLMQSSREAALSSMKDRRVGLAHHQEIYNAVIERDEELAASLMRHHLDEAYKNVKGE
ncbi:MAG: FadR/GntR family transcriptional regulator [Saccharofermentanales bacterium]|jgi:GntR family transcriptional repressor for pyruvate dehydrogenase complex